MNLRQCEVFRAIMETGTITAAATRLHVTQPAVSKMLAQLERNLGFPVFLRQRRRLVPTQDAQALYQEVRRAFIGLDYLTRFAGDLRDLRQGHLVVAASHATATFYLPGVVAAFLQSHPGLSVSLHTMDSPAVAQAVATGRVDQGVAQFEVPAPGLRRERLLAVPAVCVMPPEHSFARVRVVRAADLHGQNLIALATVNRLRMRLTAILEEAGVVPRIRADTPLASAACRLVMAGVGICVLDQLSAEANLHQGVVLRPFRPAIVEDTVLLTLEQSALSSAAVAFMALLRQSFRDLGMISPAPSSVASPAPRRRRLAVSQNAIA
jgi:DNA-binding transcriptional LysR family regulator